MNNSAISINLAEKYIRNTLKQKDKILTVSLQLLYLWW